MKMTKVLAVQDKLQQRAVATIRKRNFYRYEGRKAEAAECAARLEEIENARELIAEAVEDEWTALMSMEEA